MDKAWLDAAKAGDVSAMKALADHYEEQGDKLKAAQWRCKAGLSRLVYQVYNPNTGEVRGEFKTMAACKGSIGGIPAYKERSVLKIRVVEFTERPVIETKPTLAPRDNWTGPATVIAGELAGKSGEVVSCAYYLDASRVFCRVAIDGVEHEIAWSDLEYLQ